MKCRLQDELFFASPVHRYYLCHNCSTGARRLKIHRSGIAPPERLESRDMSVDILLKSEIELSGCRTLIVNIALSLVKFRCIKSTALTNRLSSFLHHSRYDIIGELCRVRRVRLTNLSWVDDQDRYVSWKSPYWVFVWSPVVDDLDCWISRKVPWFGFSPYHYRLHERSDNKVPKDYMS